MNKKPDWFKTKGYLHLTPSISSKSWRHFERKITDPLHIAKYNFFPLIHRVISERKYKKVDQKKHIVVESKMKQAQSKNKHIYRDHKHQSKETNKVEPTRKNRHIYYAAHNDALVYSYYSTVIYKLYSDKLKENDVLNQSVIAYRKISIDETNPEGPGKSTIHFAKEVFDEIENQSEFGEVGVLAFDITNFFPSMDHSILRNAWIDLVGEDEFQKHHFRIYEACTKFRYVNYNDLKKIENKRNNGFNESRLNDIRKTNGIKSVFGSYVDFRNAIRDKELRVYDPNHKKKHIKGIPQGLPISATLANLYLLEFDQRIISNVCDEMSAFYRRYSDDIVIVCPLREVERAETEVLSLISDVKLRISPQKTERYKFREQTHRIKGKRLECFLLDQNFEERDASRLIYLGFEFYGYQTLIKSSNLSKYYRRLIKTVTRRAKRVRNAIKKEPTIPRAIFYNQIKKIVNKPLKHTVEKADSPKHNKKDRSTLVKDSAIGEYNLVIEKTDNDTDDPKNKRSTYMGYVNKCRDVFGTEKFHHQLRKRKFILRSAIIRKLNKYAGK